MSALKLLLAFVLAAGTPEVFKTSEGYLFEDDLTQVDRPFDAAGFKSAHDAFGRLPHTPAKSDNYTTQRQAVFADALLRMASYYEETTYQLYPHRPLDRPAALRLAAPLLAVTPFAKGLPAKPSKQGPRSITWSTERGALYDLIFDLDAKGRVVRITLDWGV